MATAKEPSSAKKTKKQTLHIAEFLSPTSGSNWADDVPDADELPSLPTRPGEASFPSQPRRLPEHPPWKAFIGNIPYEATVGQIAELFYPQLDVVDAHLIKTREGKPRGCFVEFGNRADLEQALQRDGTVLLGRSLRIDLAEARPEDRPDRSRSGQSEPEFPGDGRRSGFGNDYPSSRDSYRDSGPRGVRGFPGSRSDFPEPRGFENRPFPHGDRGPRGGYPPDRSDNGAMRDFDRGFGPRGSYEDDRRGRGFGRDSGGPGYRERDLGMGRRDRSGDEPWGRGPAGPGFPRHAEPPTSEPEPPRERPRLQLAPRSKAADEGPQSTGPTSAKANPFGDAKPVDATARLRELEERQAKRRAEEAAERSAEAARRASEEGERARASHSSPDGHAATSGFPSAPRGGRGRARGPEGVRGVRGGRGEGRGPGEGPDTGRPLRSQSSGSHQGAEGPRQGEPLEASAPAGAGPPGQPLLRPPRAAGPSSEPQLDFTSAGTSLGLDPDGGFLPAGNSRTHRTARGRGAPLKSSLPSPPPPGLQQQQSSGPPGLHTDEAPSTQIANAFAALNADDE